MRLDISFANFHLLLQRPTPEAEERLQRLADEKTAVAGLRLLNHRTHLGPGVCLWSPAAMADADTTRFGGKGLNGEAQAAPWKPDPGSGGGRRPRAGTCPKTKPQGRGARPPKRERPRRSSSRRGLNSRLLVAPKPPLSASERRAGRRPQTPLYYSQGRKWAIDTYSMGLGAPPPTSHDGGNRDTALMQLAGAAASEAGVPEPVRIDAQLVMLVEPLATFLQSRHGDVPRQK